MIKRAKEKGKPLFDEHGEPVWEIDIRVSQGPGKRPKRIRSREFRSRDEAEKAVVAIRQAHRARKYGFQPRRERPRLQELIARRLPTLGSKSERTRARRVLYRWLQLLDPAVRLNAAQEPVAGYVSPVTVEEVTTPRIRRYVETRRADGIADSSVNRELNTIAATLHAAAEFFPELEQWRPPKIPRLKVSSSRREMVITDEQYQALVNCLLRPADSRDGRRAQDQRNAYQARVRVAHVLQFAMLTGARHSEINRVQWRDIDWAGNRVLIYQRKTDRYKQVPLTAPLRDVLQARRQTAGDSERVFTKGAGEWISWHFYKILRKACEECGIPYGKQNPDGIVLHTARHTIVTRLVQAGVDYDTIGQVTGHSAKELIAHYSHHSPASMARAAAALVQNQPVLDESGQNLDKK